jgi:hypothetical protein
MSRFSCVGPFMSPLLIQLSTNTTGQGSYASVFAAEAAIQVVGTISRPILYRPAAPGTLSLASPAIRSWVPDTPSYTFVASSFTSNPSIPTVSTGAFPQPITISWMTDPSNGIVVATGGALVLYATATNGAAWKGGISWEEQ